MDWDVLYRDTIGIFCFAYFQINSTRKKVLKLPLSGKSRVFQYEVFSFLEDLRGTEVTLRLSKFIEIGRPRLITMMVIALTYCIVLSQFALLDS
ncbi:Gustatory and odorant receptor 24 [Frankliniella fusca]|uniref:Gustatory and odorant receptor 24 n=1 Tax=Frankliniella fusca TaxID=407009 RepID=A0AAE1H2M2_9NEOP|nr:Gustatory and odorant receptor 24 [Frankliniella fusca]